LKRPFIITSAYAGAQRYSSSWTGDNVATGAFMDCKHTSQRMSISGMGFTGSDIGFAEQPSGDLYARWIQLGFSSFLSDTLFRGSWRSEPWAFDELLILLENLLTYGISCYHIYTMFWQYIERNSMLKPLVYYDQTDIQTHYRNDEFILETKF
jgi:alpha-glucosidase